MLRLCLTATLIIAPVHALAAEKRIFRIDSMLATQKGSEIVVEAKGAVQTGGWTKPRLHLLHTDGHVMTVEFVATPPPADMKVIDALVPVIATAQFRTHAVSVHVQADENEITTQVLR